VHVRHRTAGKFIKKVFLKEGEICYKNGILRVGKLEFT